MKIVHKKRIQFKWKLIWNIFNWIARVEILDVFDWKFVNIEINWSESGKDKDFV
jgi:hypothetical protein